MHLQRIGRDEESGREGATCGENVDCHFKNPILHTPSKHTRISHTTTTWTGQHRCECECPSDYPSTSLQIRTENYNKNAVELFPGAKASHLLKKHALSMPAHLLSSLLVTYTLTDRDHCGIRAVVPRAVPLSPDFHPKVTEYRAVVPWWVHEVELETPHAPGAQVEVTGNQCLKRGWNVVKVVVHATDSRETLQYTLLVKRQSEGGFLRKFGLLGVASALFVTGLLILTKRRASVSSPSSVTPVASESRGIKTLFHSMVSLGKS